MFTNLNLTDMETGYKAFNASVIKSIQIEEDHFGFEAEITAKLARADRRIYEVGISYSGRTYAEGKKIHWRDGVRAIYTIVEYNLKRPGVDPRELGGGGRTKLRGYPDHVRSLPQATRPKFLGNRLE